MELPYGLRSGIYTGTLVNGVPNGYGCFESHNPYGYNWIYVGQFTNGVFSGDGSTYWENGKSETGTYVNGTFSSGTLLSPSSFLVYEAQFSDPDSITGIGSIYDETGALLYSGSFENGSISSSSADSSPSSFDSASVLSSLKSVLGSAEGIDFDMFYDSSADCFHIVTIFDGPLAIAQFANDFDFTRSKWSEMHNMIVDSYPIYLDFIRIYSSTSSLSLSLAQSGVPSASTDYTIVLTVFNGNVTYDMTGIYGSNEQTGTSSVYSLSSSGSHSAKSLSPGEWECPRHISSGEYSVSCLSSTAAHIAVYRNGEIVVNEALFKDGGNRIGRLVLMPGDVVKISHGELCFTALSK